MRRRLVSFLTLVCLVVLPAVARPAEAELPAKPTIVVRLDSIDHLLADGKYLASLAGKDNQAQQVEGFAKTMLGGNLGGLDSKRPIYVYGSASSDGFNGTGAVLLPVGDEKALLATLERFNLPASKGADGIYTLKAPNLPDDLYFRFAHKYAYITYKDKSAVEKDKLIEPNKLLPGTKVGTATVLVRLDQIPDGAKQLALGNIELKLTDAKDKREPGETDLQHKFKVQIIEEVGQRLKDVINDGRELTVVFNVDRKTGEIVGEISLAGKPGSTLAANIADLGKARSLFAGALGGESALTILVHGALPPDLQKSLGPVVDEAIQKGLEKEQDAAKRALGEKVARAVAPTLKAGRLDLVLRFLGPNTHHHYTLVAAAEIKQGARVEQALRDVIGTLPESERSKFKLDAETADGVKIHRIDAQGNYDAKAKEIFGEHPFYVAVGEHRLVVAGGPNALGALKEVLAAKGGPAPPFVANASVARLALMATRDSGDPEKIKTAEEALKDVKGDDQVQVTVSGGEALTARVIYKAEAVKLLIKLIGQKAAE
jgi:hypothetical protein